MTQVPGDATRLDHDPDRLWLQWSGCVDDNYFKMADQDQGRSDQSLPTGAEKLLNLNTELEDVIAGSLLTGAKKQIQPPQQKNP